jgi:hypothetical protein
MISTSAACLARQKTLRSDTAAKGRTASSWAQ